MAKKKTNPNAEKDRIKKQLGVLGILLVMVVAANWKTISKSFGGKKKRGAPSRGKRRARGGRSRAAKPKSRAAAAKKGGGGNRAALTPKMIPQLDEAVRKKIKEQQTAKTDLIPEDVIRYDTRNPFVALSLDDREIFKKLADDRRKPPTLDEAALAANDAPAVSSGIVYFRGVVPIGADRFAVLQGTGMPRPRPIKIGDKIPKTNWTLLSVGPRDAFAVLYNEKAKRDREKISVVNRDGVRLDDVAMAHRILHASAGIDIKEGERKTSETEKTVAIMLDFAQKKANKAAGTSESAGFLNPAPRNAGAKPAATKPDPDPEPEPESDGSSDFDFFEN